MSIRWRKGSATSRLGDSSRMECVYILYELPIHLQSKELKQGYQTGWQSDTRDGVEVVTAEEQM